MTAVPADAAPRERLACSRERYFLAAYELLGEHGSTGLTVVALCERVGVTKGSFYHHFADLPEFVAAFAQRWQAWVEHIIDDYLAEPDLLRRMELAVNSHVALLVGAEPAIWAWGHTEPTIAAALRAVRGRGDELGRSTYGPITGDPQLAKVLTDMAVWAMLGMQQRAEPIDRDRFVRVMAEWARRCVHVDLRVERIGERSLARALGWLPEPIPRYRPVTLPEIGPGGTRPLFDAAIDRAVAELSPAGSRGREAYFRAAREILAEYGSDGVTVAALCGRVGVTKGSFHHHFTTIGAFVAALAEHWEQKFGALIDRYWDEPDVVARLELMFRTAFALPHPTEAAFRAWGRTNPTIAAALRRQERRAEDALEVVLVELLGDAEAADLMAEFGLGLAIGLQEHDPPLPPETYVIMFVEWARRCLRLDADLVTVEGVAVLALARRD